MMVQNILRCFSPGFVVLTHGKDRLAYMQILDRDAPRDQYQRRFAFYEMHNEEFWNDLATRGGKLPLLAMLQREMDQGRIKWETIITSPTGMMRRRTYDTSGVTLEEDESDTVMVLGGRPISKTVKLSKPLHELPSTLEETPPKVAPSEEMIIHCDIPGCEAQVSMVSNVARKEHGWGRLSVYTDPGAAGVVGHAVTDHDLCVEHNQQVTAVLRGQGG
jgi:hypothetical protein